jgi:hypothetical protein
MHEYEMRLHTNSGALSIVMKTLAIDDNDARRTASQLLIGNITSARIFKDDNTIGVVQRTRAQPHQRPTLALCA